MKTTKKISYTVILIRPSECYEREVSPYFSLVMAESERDAVKQARAELAAADTEDGFDYAPDDYKLVGVLKCHVTPTYWPWDETADLRISAKRRKDET